MHEVSQRWAVTMSVIAAVEGVLALILGAFVAPIPSHIDATQLATSLFIRGFLALLALAAAFVLAYYGGYRIQSSFEPAAPGATSVAASSSPLIALFVTPGPRRDAVYAGAFVLAAYWLITTLYIAALGNTVGGIGVTSSTLGPFIASHILQGIALVAAGAGAGGLGARNATTRMLTRRVFDGSSRSGTTTDAQPIAPPATSEAPETATDAQ